MITRWLIFIFIMTTVLASSLHGQTGSPGPAMPRPEAVYTPMPVYRPEWARQGLAGKGVVLVTIDKETGKVTGARMLESTGSQLLDGSALQAYSQWRFKPGTVTQLKLPIEFRSRPAGQTSNEKQSRPALVYVLLIFLGLAAAVMATRRRRNPLQ